MVASARASRDRLDRLLQFWVALAALAGTVVFGSAAVSELGTRAWVPGALCTLLAMPCALIVVLNVVVEAAGYALVWVRVIGTVLAVPFLVIPAVRRWVNRIWLPGNTSGAASSTRLPESCSVPNHTV
jgi:hypothetical protein